jgi:hypothetical protein
MINREDGVYLVWSTFLDGEGWYYSKWSKEKQKWGGGWGMYNAASGWTNTFNYPEKLRIAFGPRLTSESVQDTSAEQLAKNIGLPKVWNTVPIYYNPVEPTIRFLNRV